MLVKLELKTKQNRDSQGITEYRCPRNNLASAPQEIGIIIMGIALFNCKKREMKTIQISIRKRTGKENWGKNINSNLTTLN